MVRKAQVGDHTAMLAIINAAAQKYKGVIPADRWHEPYMPREEFESEIANGIEFWVVEDAGKVRGVMGMQDKGDVALVRHAYVDPGAQRMGVGTHLLRHVQGLAQKPILIGTWAAATWAIDFYCRNGFSVVTEKQKNRLLKTYWSIPARQVETSVVLADERWMEIERQRQHAMKCNNRAWELSTSQRTPVENREMLDAAHAAMWHWTQIGTELHRMRATMLLAEVHASLGLGKTALVYADEMRAYFVENGAPDWELAFTHAVYAHATHAAGKLNEHRMAYAQAAAALEAVKGEEDRAIVEKTFAQVPRP
jgi:N-acetylglutamate synthase-like GNAT family acetyltransferase